MTDIVSPQKRSEMMSGIKGKNTKPEIIIHKGLHSLGFHFGTHSKHLLGKPDIVLPKYKTAILINGYFWHGHDCHFFKLPKSNSEFWKEKISTTQAKDIRNKDLLRIAGWRVITIWECSLKGRSSDKISELLNKVAKQIRNNS